jgi:hypothetical protein
MIPFKVQQIFLALYDCGDAFCLRYLTWLPEHEFNCCEHTFSNPTSSFLLDCVWAASTIVSTTMVQRLGCLDALGVCCLPRTRYAVAVVGRKSIGQYTTHALMYGCQCQNNKKIILTAVHQLFAFILITTLTLALSYLKRFLTKRAHIAYF